MVLFAGTLLPYTQYVIYFTAGFLCIPTGRDFLVPGYPLLPGDEKLFTAMTGEHPSKATFMWKVFGLNFVVVSVMKFMALMAGVAAMNLFVR